VVAVVKPQVSEAGQALPTAMALTHSCRGTLEPYKVPKRFFICDAWPLTPSGKTDHQALGQMLALSITPTEGCATPCLQPLS
jgi:acyl-CoA synthetase (AMP-forming)/AMP-acid ligase II